MAIEGLSGVRGIQTQSVAAPKPVTTGKQEVPVFRTSQAAATYDKAANAVDTAVEKDNAASKTEQGQETADKEQIRKAVHKHLCPCFLAVSKYQLLAGFFASAVVTVISANTGSLNG